MSARRLLDMVRTLAALEEKVEESEATVKALLIEVDRLSEVNRRQQATMDTIFKKMQCPSCTHYLESKRSGDTIEGRPCTSVFLTRCIGIAQRVL